MSEWERRKYEAEWKLKVRKHECRTCDLDQSMNPCNGCPYSITND